MYFKGRFYKTKFLGEGDFAKCYEIDNNRVLKIFKKPLNAEEIDKFEYFLRYKNESFLFPFEFIFDEYYFYGYITKKAIGKKLSDIVDYVPLEQLSNDSLKLQKNIEYISKGKIILEDFHPKNVIYGNNLFQVIDPDMYKVSQKYEEKEIKRANEISHRVLITNLVLFSYIDKIRGNNTMRDAIKTNQKNYILERINKYTVSDFSVNEILLQIKKDLENYYKEEITSLSDIIKIVRR